MGAGVYCGRRSKTNLDAPDECSDGGFALHGTLSGQAQSCGSAIGIFSWFGRKDFASADAIVRSDVEPGAKMFFARPSAHIQTDFGKNSLHCQHIQSGQFGQVSACHLLKVMTAECFQTLLSRAQLIQIRRSHFDFCFESSKGLFDVLIALHDFELIAVVKFQCGLQCEEMFRALIAFQGLGNLLGAAPDLRVLELG